MFFETQQVLLLWTSLCNIIGEEGVKFFWSLLSEYFALSTQEAYKGEVFSRSF